ncbi:GNAT family N-acetyltransferase [Pseudalkalibacillus caeni]|uniref:GNAT family N-acetyltransferase n=1 Tax=Exobacillus caeni TaxID=2574798 RepID=A0A5R9F8Z8_9BACL|nr:GNAT family N-acetyltransferase [Pseudalkalibacillus caeni]TLS37014.1 GNAT family N-acetyltransferase [Pseudalkalibacillus caeni]
MKVNLTTERLELRTFSKEDSITIQKLANNREVADIINLPHPYHVKHAEEWIDTHTDRIANGQEYPLAVVLRETNDIVGTITLRVDKNNNKGELGYWIGRQFWGEGYATEAARRIVQFGFEEAGINKIWATAIVRNAGSIKVLERAGLRLEGILKEDRFLLGSYEDVKIYGLLKDHFIRN